MGIVSEMAGELKEDTALDDWSIIQYFEARLDEEGRADLHNKHTFGIDGMQQKTQKPSVQERGVSGKRHGVSAEITALAAAPVGTRASRARSDAPP